MAGDVAPLGHQAGDPRKDLNDLGRGFPNEHYGTGRSFADTLDFVRQKGRTRRLPGVDRASAFQARDGLGSGPGPGVRGARTRQGPRLNDPEPASLVENPLNILRRAEVLLQTHAPFGERMQTVLLEAGLI